MKKRMKICAVVRHAFQMVGHTWKSYALLSVTIVLSFSLLLAYLTFSDSEIYNENKVLFSYRRQDIRLFLSEQDVGKLSLVVDRLSNMENTAYYVFPIYHLGHIATKYAFEKDGEYVSFHWFRPFADPKEMEAYTHFLTALCEMAKTQKRITAKEKEVDNEKYAFRCFLLRLGFIGDDYKYERKILLRNLEGSSAFKSGSKKEVEA